MAQSEEDVVECQVYKYRELPIKKSEFWRIFFSYFWLMFIFICNDFYFSFWIKRPAKIKSSKIQINMKRIQSKLKWIQNDIKWNQINFCPSRALPIPECIFHIYLIKADVRAKRTKKEPPKDHRRHTKGEEIQFRDCQQKFRERPKNALESGLWNLMMYETGCLPSPEDFSNSLPF